MDITFEDGGAPQGKPVLYLHGAFGTRLEGCYYHDAATRNGIRLISTDRPGVGGTPLQPGRTVLDIAKHVEAVADHLGIDELAVAGHSNGGMYALAAAHALPRRVTGVLAINPTIPMYLPEALSSLRGFGRYAYTSAVKGTPEQHARSARMRTSSLVIAVAGKGSVKGRERALMRGVTGEHLHIEVSNGVQDWGFDHLSVTQPVVFCNGSKDPGTPYVRTWAEALPLGRIVEHPGGHNTHFRRAAVLDSIMKTAAGL